MTDELTVLVTGATGSQGGAVARELLAGGHQVRAMTRRVESEQAAALATLGATVVPGDFEDRDSLRRAAAGADAAFIMGTPFEADTETETRQSIAAIDAVLEAGVPHLVYSSVASAFDDTGIPHFESKVEVEHHLRSVAPHAVVIAPAAFLGDLTSSWYAPGLRDGTYATPLPADAPLQHVALADIGAFARLAIESPDRFAGTRTELASVTTTGAEIAARLSEGLGKQINYVQIPIDVVGEQMGEDGLAMFEWFRAGGFAIDVAGLHAAYPEINWHDLDAWIGGHDLAVLR